jgi:hypothetical protein
MDEWRRRRRQGRMGRLMMMKKMRKHTNRHTEFNAGNSSSRAATADRAHWTRGRKRRQAEIAMKKPNALVYIDGRMKMHHFSMGCRMGQESGENAI